MLGKNLQDAKQRVADSRTGLLNSLTAPLKTALLNKVSNLAAQDGLHVMRISISIAWDGDTAKLDDVRVLLAEMPEG